MKSLHTFLLALVLVSAPAVAQTVNLFDWSQGNVMINKQASIFDDSKIKAAISPNLKIRIFKEFQLSSPDNKYHYTLRLNDTDQSLYDDNTCYDAFTLVDSKGDVILYRWGRDPLSTVKYLTTNLSDDRFFIQVPLDEESFALIFSGWLFQFDDGAVEMIIVVVRKDKATVVFDGNAFAYKYTAAPNFSMEFTDDVYGLLNNEGRYTVTEAALKSHNKYKIWCEGNLLKYKSWK